MSAPAFVVESPAINARGVRVGTMRVYVATEARALEIAAEVADRTYRSIEIADMPEHARETLKRSQEATQ